MLGAGVSGNPLEMVEVNKYRERRVLLTMGGQLRSVAAVPFSLEGDNPDGDGDGISDSEEGGGQDAFTPPVDT